jgi:hypothetical protein
MIRMVVMRRARCAALTGAVSIIFIGVVPRDANAQPACTAPKTTCGGTDGYYASTEDVNRVTAVVDPLLRDLRACLDTAGGKHVSPSVMIRWDAEGNAVGVKVDAPGYDSLPCVAKVAGKLSQLQNPHETAIRCDFGCAKPAPAKPAPPPVAPVVVVPPPAGPVAPTAPAPAPVAAAPAPVPPPEKYEKVWYGWQTLIADSVSLSLFGAGALSKTPAVTTTGVVGFLLATPIVHMVHGNVGKGFGSIGIRLMLPLVSVGIGALAGLIASSNSRIDNVGDRVGDGAIIGFIVGLAGCVLIDAAALAYTKEKVETAGLGPRLPERQKAASRQWFTLMPSLDIQKDRAALGISGRF